MHALRGEKLKALELRKAGASYSQIRKTVRVSKSSLSLWLHDMPLSKKRLGELQGFNEARIEKYRETRRKTREARRANVRKVAKKDIGSLSKRDLFLAGLFLYWGGGWQDQGSVHHSFKYRPRDALIFHAVAEIAQGAQKSCACSCSLICGYGRAERADVLGENSYIAVEFVSEAVHKEIKSSRSYL